MVRPLSFLPNAGARRVSKGEIAALSESPLLTRRASAPSSSTSSICIVDLPVARTDRRRVDAERRTVVIRNRSARLFDQQLAGRHVPRVQSFFPKPVEPPAGDVRHVDRRRTVAPNAARTKQKFLQAARKMRNAFEIVRKTGDDQRFSRVCSSLETRIGLPFRLAPRPFSAANSSFRVGS